MMGAPELRLKDLAGKTVSLTDYRGKPVLIDFWATWCLPCRREMPLFEKLHREGVVVLTVDADESAAVVTEYMKTEKFTFPVLLAEGTDAVKRWGVVAFPTTVVMDSEGRVAAAEVGGRGEMGLREMLGKAK
jgi:thiol-disulfide isomerase/thioredoxin